MVWVKIGIAIDSGNDASVVIVGCPFKNSTRAISNSIGAVSESTFPLGDSTCAVHNSTRAVAHRTCDVNDVSSWDYESSRNATAGFSLLKPKI